MRRTSRPESRRESREGRALVVGVTGGIASGKTTVARALERLGGRLIDADRIGREIVESSLEVQAALREAFGESVYDARGVLDRGRLAEKVFSDRGALDRLNRIVHPHLLAEIRSQLEAWRSEPDAGVVVIDAALLVEWGAREWVDYLVVVESDPEAQIERIQSRDGLTREGAVRRMEAQLSDLARAAAADEIVPNRGSRDDLVAEANRLWRRLEKLAGGRTGEETGR